MTYSQKFQELITRLEQEHSYDRDGGMYLAHDLARRVGAFPDADRTQLLHDLLEAIELRDQQIWSISAEAIILGKFMEVREESLDLVRRHQVFLSPGNIGEDDLWIRTILLMLLTLKEYRVVPFVMTYLKGRSLENVTPLVAALALVDEDEFIRQSANLFLELWGSGSCDSGLLERILPALIHRAFAVNDNLLPLVVSNVVKNSVPAARALVASLAQVLKKPWMLQSYGNTRIVAVLDRCQAFVN